MNAPIQTGWVKPPFASGGLDHLGVQAPCIQIYGQLLPGITNVTDRARYYSFYCWLLNEFDKKGWRQKEAVIANLRKADCLFSLIAIRHGLLHGDFADHAGAAVGSNTLSNVVSELRENGHINLSDFTHFNEGDKSRYFKNPMGGLGQYYFGVLYELNLMSGDSVTSARLIKETGVKIADAMAQGVTGDKFISLLEQNEVTLSDLDALSCFCHCQLTHSSQEATLLISLLREGWPSISDNNDNVETPEGKLANEARASSLALMIKLSGLAANSGQMFDVFSFRGMVYSQTDHEKHPIHLSDKLNKVASHWQVYQRNEVLAVAMQGLFFSMLRAADLQAGMINQRFRTTRSLSGWFWREGPGRRVLESSQAESLAVLLQERCNLLPPFDDWVNEAHEIQLIEKIVKETDQKSVSNDMLAHITEWSLNALAAVCCRPENQAAYGAVQFRAGYLDPYPVNLNSVPRAVKHTVAGQTLHEALVSFTSNYGLDSHIRVAMRKLRQQGKNTSRFEITEYGLAIKDIPPATHTSPRFYQTMRILRDLGLVIVRDELLVPSESGQEFVEAVQ